MKRENDECRIWKSFVLTINNRWWGLDVNILALGGWKSIIAQEITGNDKNNALLILRMNVSQPYEILFLTGSWWLQPYLHHKFRVANISELFSQCTDLFHSFWILLFFSHAPVELHVHTAAHSYPQPATEDTRIYFRFASNNMDWSNCNLKRNIIIWFKHLTGHGEDLK